MGGAGVGGGGLGLIINGACLAAVLRDEDLKYRLYELTCHCQSVVCCRVSPSQKAEVVCPLLQAERCDMG